MSSIGLPCHNIACPPIHNRRQIKSLYRYWVNLKAYTDGTQGRLTEMFRDFKISRSLESYLDIIKVPADRKLYIQFRHGSLPVNAFTNSWSANRTRQKGCPCCPCLHKSIGHLLFAWTAYAKPRSKWLTPVCRQLGTRDFREALRILKSDARPLFVCATANFLGHSWAIRRRSQTAPRPTTENCKHDSLPL